MPNHEKVMCRAGKYSTCNAPVVPCADTQDTATWRRISYYNLPKTFSLTPDFYAITICGEAYSYTASQSRVVEIQRVIRTYHPYIAVGKAVLDFFKDNSRASITSITILKRYEKP
jgi:hypothetical protein